MRDTISIVDTVPEHFAQVLELNETFVHFLSPLDIQSLKALAEEAGYFRVAVVDGKVLAFLIAVYPGAHYASPNYLWFDREFDDFAYIDRIVVSRTAQGKSLATKLYNDLGMIARAKGITKLACEYNIKPMNEGSAKFHDRYGFREVGQQQLGDKKRVSLQAYSLE